MILETIAAATRKRIAAAQEAVPLSEMFQRAFEMPKGNFRLETALRGPDISFICEVKKASPSKGLISEDFPYLNIAHEYETAGACAISVLTEPDFFQGSNRHLSEIKQQVKVPLLRKDFTIDEYQLYEAKVIGADAVLLICALLDTDAIRHYIEICNTLGLSVLVEAHNAQEVESAVAANAKIIGINNRNLKTFQVQMETCASLRPLVPKDVLFVAESGIQTAKDITILRQAGVNAVLIGETLMRSSDKSAALLKLQGKGTP